MHYLLHPNIPKPLHGVNPRSIMGEDWWNEQRQKTYALKKYHCFACSIYKLFAKEHQWLECHEIYDIDYKNGLVVFKELVALCHYCHNYIHSGRLQKLCHQGTINKTKLKLILDHGDEVLDNDGFKPNIYADYIRFLEFNKSYRKKEDFESFFRKIDSLCPAWDKWRMLFNGKEYKPLFNSQSEWSSHYESKNSNDHKSVY